jgi:hypothetical protein
MTELKMNPENEIFERCYKNQTLSLVRLNFVTGIKKNGFNDF